MELFVPEAPLWTLQLLFRVMEAMEIFSVFPCAPAGRQVCGEAVRLRRTTAKPRKHQIPENVKTQGAGF